MNPPRRDWRLVATGVVVVLLVLVVVGRVQGQHLGASDAGPSRATSATVATDDTPVASGLAVAAGTVLRLDPDRHQVTGRVELGAPAGGAPVGPLAVGASAVWVGNSQGTVTARVDPERLRVTARLGGHVAVVAHGVLWSWCCRRGDAAMGFGRRDADTLRPRPPLVVTDAAGRRHRRGVDPGARRPAAVAGAAGAWPGPCHAGARHRVRAGRGRRRGVGAVGDGSPWERA